MSQPRPQSTSSPPWALSADTVLPPVTIVVTPHDDPQYMRMAFAAHQPRFGRITVHPTPLAGEGIHVAHDLIRGFGKHLLLPDNRDSPPWRFGHIEHCWSIAAAWAQALGITRVTVCRAHLLRAPKWQSLLEFSTRTGVRLTLLCNGPLPREAVLLLDSIPHRIVKSPGEAAAHWREPVGLRELEGYPWWRHHAVFPPDDDEPWFPLLPHPRPSPTAGSRPRSAQAGEVSQGPTPGPDQDAAHPDIGVIVDRIYTRIVDPVDAVCVAVCVLTGRHPQQGKARHAGSNAPAYLPPWAALLLQAARHLTVPDGGNPDVSNLLPGYQKYADIDEALSICRLLITPPDQASCSPLHQSRTAASDQGHPIRPE
jgi:hypothetical protein